MLGKSTDAYAQTLWWARNDLAEELSIGGTQLVTGAGYCLTYVVNGEKDGEEYNFEDSFGNKEIRVQIAECISPETIQNLRKAGDDIALEEAIHQATHQHWAVEPKFGAEEEYYIRSICSTKVLRRIKSCGDHDSKVFKGQKSCEFHFDFVLDEPDQCIGTFGVDNCLFGLQDKGLTEAEE